MLHSTPTLLSNDDVEELFNEAEHKKLLRNSLTNVFSSANQMTRSRVSTATTTTLSVTKTFANVRTRQKYNEEKEAEI